MKKSIKRLLGATCALALLAGAGVALGSVSKDAVKVRAAEGDVLATFSSADVVGGTATSYTSYSDDNWELNVGGNKVSAGWNKTASNAKQVGSTFAIDSTSVTATTYGWVASTKADVANAGKLVFSYTGGSGNGSGKLWLGYSTDGGESYSKVTLTSGTQGSSCGSTNTNYTFEFDTIESARYAIIVTGGASGSAFRFDSVTAILYEGSSSSATLESISVSGSMTKTSYYAGESWNPTGLTVTAYYDDESSKDVTSNASWTYSPASPAVGVTSVVATASFGGESASSSAQSVSVTRTNPIQVLYTQTSGASVDVYGYYVGFLDGTGPVIMDGEYGIVIYNKTADVSGYTAGETILHVTGSISIYKGLYEIGSASMSVASGTYDVPATPVVYSTSGSETAEYASRLTTVTGTPTLTSGSFDDAAGTNDIKMNFAVGTKTVQVFYKKAAQTADAEAFTAIKAAVADSTEITIKGFTGWYDGFQVQMNGYVKPAEGYTAEDFAQDLIDQVSEVCDGWDGETDNHDALEAIWSDLASNDKYPSLPSAEKTKLAEADAVKGSSNVLEDAMYWYDFCTAKYNLSNFINGRNPSGLIVTNNVINNTVNSSTFIIVVTVVALISVTSIGALVIIKRRKAN